MIPIFGSSWPMPVEVVDWQRWGFGFDDFAGWSARLGVSIIRLATVSWPDIETSPGVYDFNSTACPLEHSLRLLQAAGLRVYMNPSTRTGQPNAPAWHVLPSPAGDPRPYIDTKAFEKFVAALVTYCSGFTMPDGSPMVVLYGWGNEVDSDDDPIGRYRWSIPVSPDATDRNPWSLCAQHQWNQYSLPFARAVRSVLPEATICGPETMTYGYGYSMLKAENEFLAASSGSALWPYARPVTDTVSTHGYAFGGHFPEDALKRLSGDGDTLETWMRDVLNGRAEMIGEVGIEHNEDPFGFVTYVREITALNRFQYVFFHHIDDQLTKGRPAKAKSLEPNDAYLALQSELKQITSRHRAVAHQVF